jgi:hypothetical protein
MTGPSSRAALRRLAAPLRAPLAGLTLAAALALAATPAAAQDALPEVPPAEAASSDEPSAEPAPSEATPAVSQEPSVSAGTSGNEGGEAASDEKAKEAEAREALFQAKLESEEGAPPAEPFNRDAYWDGYTFLGYELTPSGSGGETARLSLGDLRAFAASHGDALMLENLPLRPGDGDPATAPLVATLALPGDVPYFMRPSVLVVAGLDGRHLVGVEAAVRLIKRVAERVGGNEPADPALAALLRERALLVVPCLSERAVASSGMAPNLHERAGNNRPFDDDRDGFVDEDRADDLNGDGVLSWMRVEDPDGAWAIDPDDARLMHLARPERGERGGWTILPEGADDDGDGAWNEDGRGGVNLSRNFPYNYPWFEADAGTHQVSEMETRALADFVVSREGIGLVVVLGLGENLAKSPEGTDDPSDRKPMETWVKGDAKYLGQLAKQWRDAVGLEKELEGNAVAGDFADWMYYHRGRMALKASIWTPEQQLAIEKKREGDKKKESKKEKDGDADGEKGKEAGKLPPFSFEQAPLRDILAAFASASDAAFAPLDAPLAGWMASYASPEATLEENLDHLAKGLGLSWRKMELGAYAVAKEFAPLPDSLKGDEAPKDLKREREFLGWIDRNAPERFLQWDAVALQGEYAGRRAEVGGFAPGSKINPPGRLLDAALEPQIDFLAGLVGKLPRLAIDELAVRRLGSNAWEISFRVRNDGYLPTVLAQGERSQETPPCWAEIELPNDRFLGGRKRTRLKPLEGGASVEIRAVVAGAEGEEIVVRARSAYAGEATATATLK